MISKCAKFRFNIETDINRIRCNVCQGPVHLSKTKTAISALVSECERFGSQLGCYEGLPASDG